MILLTNFLTFMLLIGSGILNIPVLAAATNVPDLNDDSTLITVSKILVTTPAVSTTSVPTNDATTLISISKILVTKTSSSPAPLPTFNFICDTDNCANIYNKCITNPKGHDDHFHCMLLTCYTYAFKVSY